MKYYQMMLTAACAVSMMPAALAAAPIAPAPVSAPAVTVEGTAVDLGGAAPYQENGVWMVPLRAVAGPMGYEVTWCPEDNGVLVADEAVKMNLTYGVDSYARASQTALGMTAPQSYGAGPEAWAGVTYVPAGMFSLLGYTVEEGEDTLAFTQEQAQLPNPMVAWDTLEEAEEAVGFALPNWKGLEGREIQEVFVIGGELLEVRYEDGLTCRMARGTQDVSGDYQVYAEETTRTVDGRDVTLKGEDGTVSLAVWNDGTYTWSLSWAEGVAPETLEGFLA